jgi:SAM-dependent methyltransferase
LASQLQRGDASTFDAGCGTGAFTMYAAKLGNAAIGLTIDQGSADRAAHRASLLGINSATFLRGDLRELDRNTLFHDGQFDQIICFEVIEHILDDRKLIADLARLLRPNGRLLLTTPYKYYKPLVGDRLSTWEDGGHVRWGYTFEELRKLMGEHGIEIVTEQYAIGFISQHISNALRLLSGMGAFLAWALTFPLRVFLIVDPLFTRLLRYPYLTVCVVGVKRQFGTA